MSQYVVLAVLPMVSIEKRDELLKFLEVAGEHAKNNEPGVVKYASFVPRDPAQEKTVWVIEEYKDEATFHAHMALPGVKDIVAWLSTTPSPLAEAPTQHNITYISKTFHFSRPEALKSKDPWVIVADLAYHPGGVKTSIPYWQAVVDTGRESEDGTLAYGIAKDPNDENRLFTVEAYESEAYLKDVHVKSKAIEESIKNTKHLRTGVNWAFLKFVNGFLYKD